MSKVYLLKSAVEPAPPWTGVRYFAADYDLGDDGNQGHSDTPGAPLEAVAVKTLERLQNLIPQVGLGAKLVVLIKRKDTGGVGSVYRDPTDTVDSDLVLDNLVGYQGIWVRGTATDATAGAVAFADDAADRIFAGARQVTGTNAAGYKSTGVPTVSVVDFLTFAGGAPGFAAEPSLEGKRFRFDVATPTVALQNVCRMIHTNDTDTLTFSVDLPAVPATGGGADFGYIEEPGFAAAKIVSRVFGSDRDNTNAVFLQNAVSFAGVRGTSTATTGVDFQGTSVSLAFCEFAVTGTFAAVAQISSYFYAYAFFIAHDGAFANLGVGFRMPGSITVLGAKAPFVGQCAITGSGRRFIFDGVVGSLLLGSGSYCGGVSVQNCMIALIGSGTDTTARVLRCEGPGSSSRVISLTVGGNMGSFIVDGVQILNAGGSTLIRLGQAYQCGVRLRNVTGSTGNTGTGLSLNDAEVGGCTVIFDSGNTFSGAVGNDILGNGDIRYAHADYTLTDFYDKAGNHFRPTVLSSVGFGAFVNRGKALDNDGTTTLVQFGVAKQGTLAGQFRGARADTYANAKDIQGVRQNLGGVSSMIVGTGFSWIECESAPSIGDKIYLSTTTHFKGQTTAPTASGHVVVYLGTCQQVSGTKAFVKLSGNFTPMPVLADLEVTASSTITGPNAAYVIATGMSLTPTVPGRYLAIFRIHTTTAVGGTVTAAIGIASTTAVTNSDAQAGGITGLASQDSIVSTAYVTLTGSQAVNGLWKDSAAASADIRSLILVPQFGLAV